MSWDSYPTNMEGEGCCYAGLFDHEGNPWAQSKNPCMTVNPQQVQHVVKGIKTPSVVNLMADGARFGDIKFLAIMVLDNLAVLKQKDGDSGSKLMVCVAVCNRCVIIGASTAGEKEKCSRMSVEKYAEYLRGAGY